MATLLVIDDDRDLAQASFARLKQDGHTVHLAYTVADALKAMRRHQPELILTDLLIGDGTGIDVLTASRSLPVLPDVVLITGHPSMETANRAMTLGAYEYIRKPFDGDELGSLVRRILERRALTASKPPATDADAIVAADPATQETLSTLRELAGRDTTVLLRGETGVGKDVMARYLHRQGPNSDGAYVAIHCASIPDNLLAGELFGHEKGAYTGADTARAGAFERASGGTLLLDEIGDIPLETQVHLLRVIESREVTRLGGSHAIPVSPRLVAATHCDLEQLVAEGTFRQDLYFRINVFPVHVSPLRERPGDIQALTDQFLLACGGDPAQLHPAARDALCAYTWPGNVRELRNLVEHLLIRARGETISAELVQAVLTPAQLSPSAPGTETLAEIEVRRIREALQNAGGNKSRAAAALGISRRKLYSRMKILGIADA